MKYNKIVPTLNQIIKICEFNCFNRLAKKFTEANVKFIPVKDYLDNPPTEPIREIGSIR